MNVQPCNGNNEFRKYLFCKLNEMGLEFITIFGVIYVTIIQKVLTKKL